MEPATMMALATLASGLLGGLTGGKGKVPFEQRELMRKQTEHLGVQTAADRLALERKRAQDPLWRALQAMAFRGLPTFAKAGFDITSLMQNPVTGAPPAVGGRPRGSAPSIGRAVPRY